MGIRQASLFCSRFRAAVMITASTELLHYFSRCDRSPGQQTCYVLCIIDNANILRQRAICLTSAFVAR